MHNIFSMMELMEHVKHGDLIHGIGGDQGHDLIQIVGLVVRGVVGLYMPRDRENHVYESREIL